jgi:hypothetical protein
MMCVSLEVFLGLNAFVVLLLLLTGWSFSRYRVIRRNTPPKERHTDN